MSIIIDIVIIAIILFCLYRGYKKGLVGLAFSIVSFFAALIIAFILFVPVSSFVINNTEFDDNIKSAIISNFNSEETTEDGESNFITTYINEQIDEAKGKTLEVVATEISELCIKGICHRIIKITITIKMEIIPFI